MSMEQTADFSVREALFTLAKIEEAQDAVKGFFPNFSLDRVFNHHVIQSLQLRIGQRIWEDFEKKGLTERALNCYPSSLRRLALLHKLSEARKILLEGDDFYEGAKNFHEAVTEAIQSDLGKAVSEGLNREIKEYLDAV